MPSPPLNADLNALDATALRELVSALRAKNAALEAPVAANCYENIEYEARSQSGAAGCAVVKAARHVTPTDSTGDSNSQVLPLELLIMIGDYLEPGSRSLARTCNDLYALLIPRGFYKSFFAENLYRDLDAIPKRKERSVQLPSGFKANKCRKLSSKRSATGATLTSARFFFATFPTFSPIEISCAEFDVTDGNISPERLELQHPTPSLILSMPRRETSKIFRSNALTSIWRPTRAPAGGERSGLIC